MDLLIVDDDDDFRDTMARHFHRRGFAADDAPGGETALQMADRREYDAAVFDLAMPGISGLELLDEFKRRQPDCEIIMLTAHGTVDTAVQAMKSGAYDFLTKPVSLREIEELLQKALERGRLRKDNRRLRALLKRTEPEHEMVGGSDAMKEVYWLIERAGPSDKAILIQGESGTGKELVARALHRNSRRGDRPMVVINCAALPETLLESELFGHEKGAFTGAVSAKPGMFEIADQGTLFIDEIGELPGSLQAKLLRVLEDGSLRRIGSVKERRVDVRLLAATNRNLSEDVEHGSFREDLYYRINVMSLTLPPLRRRNGDVAQLVAHFLKEPWQIEKPALAAIERYPWPGNVRQLSNAIERAKILADDFTIRDRDLPDEVAQYEPSPADSPQSDDDLSAIERGKVIEVLRREAGNKSKTARVLGIERRKLYRLLKKHLIEDREWRRAPE